MKNTRANVALGLTLAATIFSTVYANHWGQLALTYPDPIEGLANTMDLAFLDMLLHPLVFSGEQIPLLVTLCGLCAPLLAYTQFCTPQLETMEGREYGSARRGTIAEGRRYRDRRNPDNNIVLTKNLGIALRPTRRVRRQVTSRNVCVFGATGSNKTTGYVMPNLLQLKADRDVVVIDPKGTTLSTCGHALLAAGIDVNVFNTREPEKSDRYNPLGNIWSHSDVIDFVNCLIENTNNGRKSADPIWDNGEALFLRALVTLMFDWFDRSELTFKNMVMLCDLADVADEGAKNTLDLLFEEIETGVRLVPATPSENDDDWDGTVSTLSGLVRVPSLLRRRDGVCPALVRRPDGTCGLDPEADEALKLWHQFRHCAGKTLQSFVISCHARLAYLSSPDVLELLAGTDGIDELHLERLGQTHDEWGRPLAPRVIFVVSSDFNDKLNALLSILCWQAIYLPMSAADDDKGRLPRPVSFIFDEFRNIGKLGSFVQTIAVVRSRNIDVSIILQTASQLKELYEEAGAKTIRGNCATTLFLGGGHDVATSRIISEETGKQTIYKRDHSKQGQGADARMSQSTSSMGREVYDTTEVATLPADRALVMIGQEHVIEDRKSLVWECKNYDPVYMGKDPKRSFDYVAWKTAGRPMGKALLAWEDVWFERELPARHALRRAERTCALSRHVTGRECEASEALLALARGRLDLAHALALEAAGTASDVKGAREAERRLHAEARQAMAAQGGCLTPEERSLAEELMGT